MGVLCFFVTLAGVLVAAGWAAVRAAGQARDGEERWGQVIARDEVKGDGAFRSARLVGFRGRRIPRVVWLAGVPGTALGVLSALVVAPASALLAMFTGFGSSRVMEPLLGVGLLTAGLSFISGYFVFAASTSLLRCERGAGERAERVGATEALLHVFPIAIFSALAGPLSVAGVMAMVLWAPGALHGLMLWQAGRRVAAIQNAMSEDERDALPEPLDPSQSM